MLRLFHGILSVWTILSLLLIAGRVSAVQPADRLVPNTTKSFMSVADMDLLRTQFDKTQLGELMADPLMKPFTEDLTRQLNEKLGESKRRLGVTWEDLDGVYGGEVCTAAIQPEGNAKDHAYVLIVDVTGKDEQLDKVLAKIDKKQLDQKAVKSTEKIPGTETVMTIYTYAKTKDEPRLARHFYVHEKQLIATNHHKIAVDIRSRFDEEAKDVLASFEPYIESLERCEEASGHLAPDVRWFIEPFGYVEVNRAARGGRKRRGTDLLKVLRNQGFTAVQGLGGYVTFVADGGQEILHRTMIYAPPVKREDPENKDRYDLAARMLDFPMTKELTAQEWVPRELATYGTFNWNLRDGFEYASTLVDEMVGEEDAFEDILSSLERDPQGPRINMRKELIAHLGSRLSIISDYKIPITVKSERLLMAIQATDPKAVEKAVEKIMQSDPDARKLKIDGHVVWEIVIEEDEFSGPPKIDGPPGLFPDEDEFDEDFDEENEDDPLFPNKSVTVLHGHLMIATHLDLIRAVLRVPPTHRRLATSADYRLVMKEMVKLGAGVDSVRAFTRTDEEFRATYDLMRAGKMPESETLFGKMLNGMFGDDEDDEPRKQEIDASKMPEYDVVRRYLGPAGLYIQSKDDGWFVAGALLTKDAPPAGRVAAEAGADDTAKD